MHEHFTEQPTCSFFLFINSGSGGGLGHELLNQQITKIEFEIPIKNRDDIHKISVDFVNMRKTEHRLAALRKLKQLNQNANNTKNNQPCQKTIAIVCGGDGSVMWVVEQFAKIGIDFNLTPIGIIPIGTGNDFSRALGWGPQKTMLLQYHYRSLKKLIRKWLHAKVRDFDLWDLTAQVYENGKFQKRNSEKVSAILDGKVYCKTFCNYFSFGIDGKVGYSFDKYRAKSRLGNLAIYGGVGLATSLGKNKTINNLVSTFHTSVNERDSSSNKQNGSQQKLRETRLLFKSKSKKKISVEQERKKRQEDDNYFASGLLNVLALNINSYTGGTKDIWKNAKQMQQKKTEGEQRVEPSFSDGKIQIVSFSSGLSIGLEKVFGGFGTRLAQDEGPFIFNFHPYPQVQRHRTYLQIDGEFLRFNHPKSILIHRSQLVPGGQIKVIQNDSNFIPYMPDHDKN